MKQSILYIIVSLALVLTSQLPFDSCDVGELRPVEVLEVSAAGGLTLRTDTGDMGAGADWESAVEDLKATAPGTVFQGTVSFLLLESGAEEILPQILSRQELNPGCGVCLAEPGMDLEAAAAYLRAHEPKMDLRRLRAGRGVLPLLREEEGRFCLYEP